MRFARALALFGAAVIATAAALTWAMPGHATPPQTAREAICPDWKLRGATGKYPDVTFGAAPAGAKVVTANKVVLAKPADGIDPGVEFAAFTLDIDLPAATPITVNFQLSTEASSAAGAVRLFYYHAQNADTLNDGPAGVAVATGSAGTLTVNATGKVGTVGLVYDGSNAALGSVAFTGLKVGTIAVKFTDHDKCDQPAPTPTAVPTATATAGPTATATAAPTTAPAGGTGGSDTDSGGLPITGVSVGGIVGVAAVLLAGGIGFRWMGRRRRVRYTA